MKKQFVTLTAVAALSLGLTHTSHAWFFRTNVNVDTSKTYNTTAGRDVGSRNNTNSNNRFSSHDVKGDVTNSNLGTMMTGSASNYSGGNHYGSARSAFGSNHTNLSGFGQNNMGNIGSGMNSVTSGGISLGDTHFVGDSAIKAASGQ